MLPLFMPVILAVYFTTATSHGDKVMTTVEGNEEVGLCQCGRCIILSYNYMSVWWSVIIAPASSAILYIILFTSLSHRIKDFFYRFYCMYNNLSTSVAWYLATVVLNGMWQIPDLLVTLANKYHRNEKHWSANPRRTAHAQYISMRDCAVSR